MTDIETTLDCLHVLSPRPLGPQEEYGLETLMSLAGIPLDIRWAGPGSAGAIRPGAPVLAYLPPGEALGGGLERFHTLRVPRTAGGEAPGTWAGNDLGRFGVAWVPAGCAIAGPAGGLDFPRAAFELASGAFEARRENGTKLGSAWTACGQYPPLEPGVEIMAEAFAAALGQTFAAAGLPLPRIAKQPQGRTMTLLLALDFDSYRKNVLERAKQAFGLSRMAVNTVRHGSASAARLAGHLLQQAPGLLRGGIYKGIFAARPWLEERGLRASFNVTVSLPPAGETRLGRFRRRVYDPDYALEAMPGHCELLAEMAKAGHEVGLQYGAFSCDGDQEEILKQRVELERLLGVSLRTGRHHCLTHSVSRLPGLLDRAGMELDTSPAWLDVSGYRYGCVSPCQAFDFQKAKTANALQVPTPLWDGVLCSRLRSQDDLRQEVERVVSVAVKYGGTVASGVHPRAFGVRDYYMPHMETFVLALETALRLGAKTATCAEFNDWWRARGRVRAALCGTGGCELVLKEASGAEVVLLEGNEVPFTAVRMI